MTLSCLHPPRRPARPDRPAPPALVIGAFAALSACFAAGPAPAHEYWLSPDRWAPARGEAVEIMTYVGTGFRGERTPYRSERCAHFLAQAARTLDLAQVARNGDSTWARFSPADRGGVMFAYESNWATIELPAAEFDAYLALEGLDRPLAARRGSEAVVPGRERYRRCAKAWLDGGDPARASKPIGATIEIVPLARPRSTARLPVRLLFHGRPLAGVLIKAWRSPWGRGDLSRERGAHDSIGVFWQARTDARGEAVVPVAEPGEWLVSAVHMVRCQKPEAADWESFWASLTFARGAASGAVR